MHIPMSFSLGTIPEAFDAGFLKFFYLAHMSNWAGKVYICAFQNEQDAITFLKNNEHDSDSLETYIAHNIAVIEELTRRITTLKKIKGNIRYYQEKMRFKREKPGTKDAKKILVEDIKQEFEVFCSFFENHKAEWDALLAELETPYTKCDPSSDEPEM